MTTSLRIHVDGSSVSSLDKRRFAVGWALVGQLGGDFIEDSGAYSLNTAHEHRHYHEHVAFVHGLLYAQKQGVAWKDLTLYCDDPLFGHAPNWMHPGNYSQFRFEKALIRLQVTLKKYFAPDLEPMVLEAWAQARFVCIKGHRFEVFQERADYLAKHSGKLCLGLADEPALSYDQWLEKGMLKYTSDKEPPELWHAPFIRNLNQTSM